MASEGMVIVTGGSRGIGAAICRKLAALGHPVAVNYTARPEAAEAVAASIKAAGGRAQAVRADVADENQVAAMFDEAVSALGPVTALVNNAGIAVDIARLEQRDASVLTRL